MLSIDQINSINGYQNCEYFNPYTCECGEKLVASKEGIKCESCGYIQSFVHPFTSDWTWKRQYNDHLKFIENN